MPKPQLDQPRRHYRRNRFAPAGDWRYSRRPPMSMPPDPTAESPRPMPARRWLDRIAWFAFLVVTPTCAILAGLQLRHYAWDQTQDIRYVTDIDNAFEQGTQALRVGYIDRYDQENQEPPNVRRFRGVIDLDYAPGRLAVATVWSWWVHRQTEGPVPDSKETAGWTRPFYETARPLKLTWRLCRPLMILNAACAAVSASAMFVLVFRYGTGGRPGRRRVVLGMLAALLFWFNPAVIWNAHCWPQWDTWVFPFLLWAMVAASCDWWFTAGALMAAGAMFKGQILFGLPLFLVWPIALGRPLQLCRFVTGIAFLFAAVTVVWDVRAPGITDGIYKPGAVIPAAVFWILTSAVGFGGIVALARAPWPWHARLPVAVAVVAAVCWPFMTIRLPFWNGTIWSAVVLTGLTAVAVAVFLRPIRSLPCVAAGFLSATALLCIPVFGGSNTWFESGFSRGTSERAKMASEESNNLGTLLSQVWGWRLSEPVYTIEPGPRADKLDEFFQAHDLVYKTDREHRLAEAVEAARENGVKPPKNLPIGIPVKTVMLAIWLLLATVCGIAAAVHHRRRSPRFLPAVAAPWIILFAVMAQMHQRYLLWGAGLATGCAATSPGLLMLDLLMTAIAVSQEMNSMYNPPYMARAIKSKLEHLIEQAHPGLSWAVLLMAAIYLYIAVRPGRSRNGRFELKRDFVPERTKLNR